MIRNPCLRPDFRFVIADDHSVVQIMGMRVHVGVVGDGTARVDDEFAAVVEQNLFVNGAIVFNGEAVAECDLDAVEKFNIIAAVF